VLLGLLPLVLLAVSSWLPASPLAAAAAAGWELGARAQVYLHVTVQQQQQQQHVTGAAAGVWVANWQKDWQLLLGEGFETSQ
jgi:hypothetical protein